MCRKLTWWNLRRGAKLRGPKTYHRDGNFAPRKAKALVPPWDEVTNWLRRKTKTETICDGDACTRSTGAKCRGGTTNHDGHAPTTLRVAGASAVCAVHCSFFFFCAHLNTLETQTMQDVNETLNAIQKLIQLTPELTPQPRRRTCSPQSRRQLQGPSRRHPNPPFKPNSDSATARAAAHERIDAHRHRHACSALLQPTDSENFVFQQTTGLPLHLPARPNDICCGGQLAQDRSLPCAVSPPGVPLHPCLPLPRVLSHQHGGLRQGLCRWPIASSEQRQTVNHDLQSSAIVGVWHDEVHVSDEHVDSDSAACLTTDAGCRALNRETSPPQSPSLSTSCTVVATGIKWTATPATALRKGQRLAKSTEQDRAEQVRLQPCQMRRW